MSRFRFVAFIFVVAIAVQGCSSKLRKNETIQMSSGDTKTYTIEGPKQDQKVKIELSSKENIAVEVVLEKNKGKKPLDSKLIVKEYSYETTIPAGEAFSIIITATKETEVVVKINSVGS